jgi:hypothetical protein
LRASENDFEGTRTIIPRVRDGTGQVCDGGALGSKVNPGSPLGQPWVPDFWVDIRGSPHKNRQPWVPATSFLFRVLGATRPNCQPLTLSHLESDGGPTVSMPNSTVMVITFSTQNCDQAGSQGPRPLPHMNLNVSERLIWALWVCHGQRTV